MKIKRKKLNQLTSITRTNRNIVTGLVIVEATWSLKNAVYQRKSKSKKMKEKEDCINQKIFEVF